MRLHRVESVVSTQRATLRQVVSVGAKHLVEVDNRLYPSVVTQLASDGNVLELEVRRRVVLYGANQRISLQLVDFANLRRGMQGNLLEDRA